MSQKVYTSGWICPSNIALVKYWGKQQAQIPQNPSVSFALDICTTETVVEITLKNHQYELQVGLDFEGIPNEAFRIRMLKYLLSLNNELPWINDYDFKITTRNTFPHSAGIASSASAFGAMGLCLARLNQKINAQGDHEDFFRYASHLARLGSGSAARSVYEGFVAWGKDSPVEGASDEWAVKINQVDPLFRNLNDSIILISAGQKEVSSSAGHALMDKHPFAEVRYAQARRNTLKITEVLNTGDWQSFAEITENEALTLHAMMLSSEPSVILLKPASLLVIDKIKLFRKATGCKITFTIDAGPNIHILYPDEHREAIMGFIESEIRNKVEIAGIIHDKAGKGPLEIR